MTDPDQLNSAMMSAVGSILMSWGRVEQIHSTLFAIITSGMYSNECLIRAYWSIQSFDARHKMTDAGIMEAFRDHNDYRAEWTAISAIIARRNKARNKIAHGSLLFNADKTVGPEGLFFIPFLNSNLSKSLGDKSLFNGAMRITDLIKIRAEFDELYEILSAFLSRYIHEHIFPSQKVQLDGSPASLGFEYPQKPPTPKAP